MTERSTADLMLDAMNTNLSRDDGPLRALVVRVVSLTAEVETYRESARLAEAEREQMAETIDTLRGDVAATIDDLARTGTAHSDYLARLRAEVDRLTRERDAAERALADAHPMLARLVEAERDHGAALVTLAMLREAAERSIVCHCGGSSGCPWTELHRALTASADPAATGARLLAEAEERGVLTRPTHDQCRALVSAGVEYGGRFANKAGVWEPEGYDAIVTRVLARERGER